MSSPAPKPDQHGGGGSAFAKIRQVLLLFVLLLAICGLGWEYLYVKPKVAKDHEAVLEMRDENPGLSTEDLHTDATVQEAIGFAPSDSKEIEDRKLEVYKYRRGIMVKFFTIACLYRKSGPSEDSVWFLADCYLNEIPEESDWAAPREENSLEIELDESPAGAGRGGGGGGARRRPSNDDSSDDDSSDDTSSDDTSSDDTSSDDTSSDDTSSDDSSSDDSSSDDSSSDDSSSDDSSSDDTSSDDSSSDDSSSDDSSSDDSSSDDSSSDDN